MSALPHWPFAELTPHQLRLREAQEIAMRERRLARWPAALAACVVAGALAGCGGGGSDVEDPQPDVPSPQPVDCHVKPEACR